MTDFNKFTRQLDFAPLIDFAKSQGHLRHYAKAEIFVHQGESSRTMAYVEHGSFRYNTIDSRGNSHIVGYTFEDSFVGNYPAFRLGDRSNVEIQAICDSKVYLVTPEQLNTFYETTDTNGHMATHIAEILLWEVYDRMISLYSQTPEERYVEILHRCPGLLNLITLKELASFLQITPETLSRLRRKLTR